MISNQGGNKIIKDVLTYGNVDQKGKVLSVFVLLPLPYIALAHGEEALVPLYIHGICLLCFLVIILALKMQIRKKVILISVYILSTISIVIAIRNIPYRDNQYWIDFLLGIVPFIIVIISYAFIQGFNASVRRKG